MSKLLLFVCIIVLVIVIGILIIFFKNRKEKNEFDDFLWEKEKRKEKELFERENDYQIMDSEYEQYDKSSLKNEMDLENKLRDDKKYENNLYNEDDTVNNAGNKWENKDNINLVNERLKYKIKKNRLEKSQQIEISNPMIKPKRKKSKWWIALGIIVALLRFCNSVNKINRRNSYGAYQQETSQTIQEIYEEWMEKAKEYEENGDYEKAEEYYNKAASYNKDVYTIIGMMYYENGDKEKGIEKLKEAYEKGVYSAAGMLGEAEEDKGNIEKAKEWYAKGIEKEDIYSQISMAALYRKEKKWDEAEKLLLKGAEQDDNASIYGLILVYLETNKEAEMKKWKEKLFNIPQIKKFSVYERDTVLYATGNENDREYVKVLLKASDLKDEGKYKEAEKLYNEAAKYNKRAYDELGNLYYVDYKNENKAIEIYKKGYAEGSLDATYSLSILENDRGNKKESERLLKICAEKGNLNCQRHYANTLYENSQEGEGLKWFKKAAEQKDAISMFKLMSYYYEKNDETEVKKWARKILTEKGILDFDYKIKNYAEEILKL